MSLREYSGNAKPTTLNGGITSGSTSIVVADGTGFPTGSTAPFVVTVEAGQAAEERILIQSRSGNTLTVATGGRGWDGTSASSHDNAASVSHTYSATDAREANAHINDVTRDDHTQYSLFKKGLAAVRGAAGRAGKFHLGVDSGLLGVDDGTTWHEFQDKASADAAYQPLTLVTIRVFQNTGGQSIPNGTVTAVTFDGESYKNGCTHNNVTNNTRVTVPTTGKYRISGVVAYAPNAAGSRHARVLLNGTTNIAIATIEANTVGEATWVPISTEWQLSAGDYIELAALQTSGAAATLEAAGGNYKNWLSVTYLGG